jgi:hypothetical protein
MDAKMERYWGRLLICCSDGFGIDLEAVITFFRVVFVHKGLGSRFEGIAARIL